MSQASWSSLAGTSHISGLSAHCNDTCPAHRVLYRTAEIQVASTDEVALSPGTVLCGSPHRTGQLVRQWSPSILSLHAHDFTLAPGHKLHPMMYCTYKHKNIQFFQQQYCYQFCTSLVTHRPNQAGHFAMRVTQIKYFIHSYRSPQIYCWLHFCG